MRSARFGRLEGARADAEEEGGSEREEPEPDASEDGVGDVDRDGGSEICTASVVGRFEALDEGLCLELRGVAVSDGVDFSTTWGRPACGPIKFRTEEKCSQSW